MLFSSLQCLQHDELQLLSEVYVYILKIVPVGSADVHTGSSSVTCNDCVIWRRPIALQLVSTFSSSCIVLLFHYWCNISCLSFPVSVGLLLETGLLCTVIKEICLQDIPKTVTLFYCCTFILALTDVWLHVVTSSFVVCDVRAMALHCSLQRVPTWWLMQHSWSFVCLPGTLWKWTEASCHWGTWNTCPQTVWRL